MPKYKKKVPSYKDDAAHNILAFHRYGSQGEKLFCVFNFGGSSQTAYRLGVPAEGTWRMVLNTDDSLYEGAGNPLPSAVETSKESWDGYERSLTLHIPAMSAQWYLFEG